MTDVFDKKGSPAYREPTEVDCYRALKRVIAYCADDDDCDDPLEDSAVRFSLDGDKERHPWCAGYIYRGYLHAVRERQKMEERARVTVLERMRSIKDEVTSDAFREEVLLGYGGRFVTSIDFNLGTTPFSAPLSPEIFTEVKGKQIRGVLVDLDKIDKVARQAIVSSVAIGADVVFAFLLLNSILKVNGPSVVRPAGRDETLYILKKYGEELIDGFPGLVIPWMKFQDKDGKKMSRSSMGRKIDRYLKAPDFIAELRRLQDSFKFKDSLDRLLGVK